MILLVAAIIVLQWVAIAYLLFDARRERDQQAKVLAEFTLRAFERESVLLNRIKPETAQPLPGDDQRVLPAAGWDDDEDAFAATRGMTKDELAERMFDAEVNGG